MKQLTPPLSVSAIYDVSFSQVTKHTKQHTKQHSKRPLCILVSLLMSQVALAETTTVVESSESQDYVPSTQVDTIVVTAAPDAANEATKTVVTAQSIQDNQINTQQDLVRYNPEVSVAEVGRYGSKGFAIRGVDGNRVAMSYDGASLPDRQVNEIFSPYGYMYEGRFSPDTELLSDVSLQVGADSFTSGSGAVGGAVNYKSKEPRDLIESGNQIGGYAKTGYTSKNEEMMSAVGIAGSEGKVEALVNYVYREGHELKNHAMISFNKDKLNSQYDFGHDPDYQYPAIESDDNDTGSADDPNNHASILPDPKHYESHAMLAKLYYSPTDEHRIGIQGKYQYRQDQSNNFARKTRTAPYNRIGFDESELTSYGLNYRYLPLESEWIDEINADFIHQQIVGVANTYNYNKNTDVFEGNKYRPQYDTTNQLQVEGHLFPIETDGYGSHSLSLLANYANTDHEFIMKETFKDGETDFTFVGPSVKKDTYSFALADSIKVSDKLDAKVGIRYDNHLYKPYITDIDKLAVEKTGEFYSVKEDYHNGKFEQKRRLDNLGWLMNLNYQVTPNWQTGYKLSTGFLAPSISQMYSAFEIMGNNLTTNTNLKPEKSLNHEMALQGDFDTFSVNATAFYTDYTDFIDNVYFERFEDYCYIAFGTKVCTDDDPDDAIVPKLVNYISADNIGKAKTYGIRLGGTWDISNLINTDGHLKLTGNMSYAKDSTDQGINLLVSQPLNGVLGLDYLSAQNDYQLHTKVRYLGAKKPEDAKVIAWEGGGFDQKHTQVIKPYEFIDSSKSVFVFDLYGSKSFDNGLKFSAGVYNIFDKKYVPWSNLRTLAETNINSMVDKNGRGIERYTAPGRNYSVSLSYEF